MKLKCFAIVLFFLIFTNISANANDIYKVIKVIDGDTFYIDFNRNNIAEKNERVRLNGIDTFETKYNNHLKYQMDRYKFTDEEILKLGYLGKHFAINTLLGKEVLVKYTALEELDNYGRRLVSINYDCDFLKNYEEEILKNGLAVIYDKSNLAEKLIPFLDFEKVQKNSKSDIKIGILNLKNNKIHKITCPYGQNILNSRILINPSNFKKYKYAKCCYKERNKNNTVLVVR